MPPGIKYLKAITNTLYIIKMQCFIYLEKYALIEVKKKKDSKNLICLENNLN